MSVEENSDLLDDLPTATSAGYGAMAYVTTYVIFFVLEGSRVTRDFREGFEIGAGTTFERLGIDPPSTFEVVGWMFYLAHKASIDITVSAMGQSQSLNMNPGFGDQTYLLIIPPAVLVAAGYLLASREGTAGTSPVKLGSSVAIGYLILSVAGVFAFRWSATITGGFGQEATLTVAPELITGTLVAGVVYPVVFGGVGGYIVQAQTADRGGGPHATGGNRVGHPPQDRQQRAPHRPQQGRQGHEDQRPPANPPGSGQPRDERRGGERPREDRSG